LLLLTSLCPQLKQRSGYQQNTRKRVQRDEEPSRRDDFPRDLYGRSQRRRERSKTRQP
jgi:hypothetical protein